MTAISAPRLDVSALQNHASDPAFSIWVGASAGSGKTKVLADRVTRLLLADVPPQRILCLTFTRAAAAEMAIRLTDRLSEWATCAEEELDKALVALEGSGFDPALRARARRLFARVLACPGGMRIQTLHGFAQEILRRFPIEAGLPPHFAVMEEVEAQALWQGALMNVWEQAAESGDEALRGLTQTMAEGTLASLLKEIAPQAQRLEKEMRLRGGFEKLIHDARAALSLQPDDEEETFARQAVAEGSFDRAGLRTAGRLLADEGSPLFKPRGGAILHWLAQEDEEGRRLWLDDYLRAFLTKEGAPFAKFAKKELLEKHPEIESALRNETRRVQTLVERMDSVKIVEGTRQILSLALRVAEQYKAAKAARAAMDYNDLIAQTLALLSRSGIAPWVLYKLDGGIDHILLDESQDTNPKQWEIVRLLADEFFSGEGAEPQRSRTLFVVGDEKQSIFSFQGADPEAFERMRLYFSKKIRAARKPYDEVPLRVSFRSAPAILRAADAVFAADAVRAGVSRDPVSHAAFRAESAGRVEVWPLLKPPEEEQKPTARAKTPEDWALPIGYKAAPNPAADLAAKLAAQIKDWIETGATVYDREIKADRPMNAGDVLVLVQRRGAFVGQLVRALKERKIPVSGVDRMALTRQLAVMDLMALLQFTLLPEDDLTLACVLRGPLIGASEDDLMALAIGRKGSLWEALKKSSCVDWTAYLQSIAALADQKPPLQILTHLLTSPCPADPQSGRRALLRRLGPDAEDPMDELLNAAEIFGQRRTPSLQAFLHDLAASEAEIKREMEQAGGRVRIMTVHASKGLEAPVVVLPDTVQAPDKKKLPKLLWNGEGLPFYLPREPHHAALRALREDAFARQLEENKRLLYVALTRPADRLIVCGFKTKGEGKEKKEKEQQKTDNSWYNLIASALTPLNQKDAFAAEKTILTPEIVIADYRQERKSPSPQGERVGEGSVKKQSLPSWLLSPPPPEPSPPRPFTPSRPSEEEPPSLSPQDARFKRGRILHRLLQSLPDVDASRREDAARRFLANPQHELTEAQQKEMADEVLRLLADERFAPFWGPDSRAEVPIVGLVGSRLISGQMDRLALVGEEVWALDYKTNRPPPEKEKDVPSAYRTQMEAYRSVLAEVYPAKTIRCFLLWTYAPRLMEIPRGA